MSDRRKLIIIDTTNDAAVEKPSPPPSVLHCQYRNGKLTWMCEDCYSPACEECMLGGAPEKCEVCGRGGSLD